MGSWTMLLEMCLFINLYIDWDTIAGAIILKGGKDVGL